MIVVATDTEEKMARDRYKGQVIIKTGVGGLNVVRTLYRIDKNIPIINFGLVGSNNIPKGTEVRVGNVKSYHPNVEFDEPEYTLPGDTTCYTNNDFVIHTDITEPVVFDMELAYIMALGFKNVEAVKIVSDNLSQEEYEETIREEE